MTIQDRFKKVENELASARQWNRLLVGAILAGTTAFILGALPPADKTVEKVVRARAFEIIDENGNVRAVLGTDESGPRLGMFDANSRPYLKLGMVEITRRYGTRPGPAPRLVFYGDMGDIVHISRDGILMKSNFGPGWLNISERDGIVVNGKKIY